MLTGSGRYFHVPRVSERTVLPSGGISLTYSQRFTACGREGRLQDDMSVPASEAEVCVGCQRYLRRKANYGR